MRRTTALLLGLAPLWTGCRGEDISFDCENQKMNFDAAAQEEPSELRAIPEQGPYPVALQLSEGGLNRLVESIVSEGVPLAGEVPFGILPQGPGTATFEAESTPVIALRDVRGCPNCVIFSVEFGVQLDSQGEPLSGGAGFADLAIPLELRADETAGTTTLVADYSRASIDDWYLSVFGFNSDTHETLSGALQILLEESIREEFGTVDLLSLSSWNIGQGDVRLLARGLIVDSEAKKLVLGMNTNLPLPASAALDLEGELPQGVPMTVNFHTELLLGMAYRMMEEGEIPRRYDEDGQPDPMGTYGVTLSDMRPRGTTTLDTQFRIWRIADGYCGFATVEMPVNISVNEQMTGIDVDAGTAQLIEGENVGIGVAAEEEEELVEENQDLVDVFREELSSEVANTLNYEELAVEDSDILFSTIEVRIDEERNSIDSWLDFVIVASEDGE